MKNDDPGGGRLRTVWEMSETELVDYCFSRGIRGDKIEFVVCILIHEMKYIEISKHLKYSVDTLKDWSVICKKKLGIKSWKDHRFDTHTLYTLLTHLINFKCVFYNPKFTTEDYIHLANDWIDDKDVHGGKTLKYYMNVVK